MPFQSIVVCLGAAILDTFTNKQLRTSFLSFE